MLALVLAAALQTVSTPPRPSSSADPAAVPSDAPSFVNEGIVNAPASEVWKVWSTPEGWKALGVAKADIDFRVDGLIRSHYKPEGILGDEGTIRNRIIAYEPQRMLAIRIDRPPSGFPFKEAWKNSWTVITLTDLPGGRTRLRIASMGFGMDEESHAMRRFFETGNGWTIKTLQAHFDSISPPRPLHEASGGHSAAAASADRPADREAIRRHIERIFKAYLDVDPATVRSTHAEDWIGFTQGARSIVRGRDGYMGAVWIGQVKDRTALPPDAPVVVDYRISEIDFAFYGDVALVPYVADVVVGKTTRLPARLRSLDVYAKVDGEWTQVGSNIDLHPDTVEALRRQPRSLFGPERQALMAAREGVWRAFFNNDRAALDRALPEETIAIDGANQEAFQRKGEVLEEARRYAKEGTRLVRLEFPRTEMQAYGDAVILYMTYLIELENSRGSRRTESGRGTEVFVFRDGAWVNAGWHLEPDGGK